MRDFFSEVRDEEVPEYIEFTLEKRRYRVEHNKEIQRYNVNIFNEDTQSYITKYYIPTSSVHSINALKSLIKSMNCSYLQYLK